MNQDIPPINYDKLEELAVKQEEEKSEKKKTTRSVTDYLGKDTFYVFILFFCLHIGLQLVASFSSLYMLTVYPVCFIQILIANQLITLRKKACLELDQKEEVEMVGIHAKKIFSLYVLQQIIAYSILVFVVLAGTTNVPDGGALFGSFMTLVVVTVVFLILFLVMLKRYMESISETMIQKRNLHKSGSGFLLAWYGLTILSAVLSLFVPESSENLQGLAEILHLTYTEPSFLFEIGMDISLLISNALIVKMILDSRDFNC